MLEVTPAEPADVPAIVELLEELGRFYGATEFEPVDERRAQVAAALFGPIPAGYALLARDGAGVVGMAAYSLHWPASGVTHSMFLKELYVRASHRRAGVGRLLMRELFEVAAARGCVRVDWTADRDGEEAHLPPRRDPEPLPLRPFRPDDLADLYELQSRPDAVRVR